MNNHFHEILAFWEMNASLVRRAPPGAKPPPLVRVCADLYASARSAIAFNSGDFDSCVGMPFVAEIARPPFAVTWVESQSTDQRQRCGTLWFDLKQHPMAHESLGDQGAVVFTYFWTREWNRWAASGVYVYMGDGRLGVVSSIDELQRSEDTNCIHNDLAFFTALNCCNTVTVENPIAPALQKARARRGKPPLFATWTLHLQAPGQRVESLPGGGTHASPRLHLRRGHARKLATGRYTWVQPHLVGDKSAGLVMKDYAVQVQSPAR